MKKSILCLFVVALWSVPALADDFAPPTWRGGAGSYKAEWDMFLNGSFNAGIDADSDVWGPQPPNGGIEYGGFQTHLDFDTPYSDWALVPPGGGGIWCPDRPASFAAHVINWVDTETEKWIRVQVTFSDSWGQNRSPSIIDVQGHDPGTTVYNEFPQGRVDVDATHFYEDWIIVPNPDWEDIYFSLPQGVIVEQVIIDTISPEPGTVSLLMIGAMAVLRRRRRGA